MKTTINQINLALTLMQRNPQAMADANKASYRKSNGISQVLNYISEGSYSESTITAREPITNEERELRKDAAMERKYLNI